MKLYLVRHAQSERNANRHSGIHTEENPELTDVGKEQAHRLGTYFHRSNIDIVFCSKLKRAKDTLKEILPFLKKNIHVIYTSKLNEMSIGVYEKNGKDDWEAWKKAADASGISPSDFRPEGGESFADVYKRAGNFYNSLLKKYKEKKVLIVGHATLNLFIIFNSLNLPQSEGRYYQLSNASVSSLSIDKKGKVKDYHINDYHHLILGGIKK